MRFTLTLLVPLIAAPLAAQIIIGPADMPSAGDTMRYRNTDATEVSVEVTGPDMLWDYSFLLPGDEGADTAVSVSSTPLLYQFYFNNALLYPAYDADLALRGPAFGFQQLTVSNVFEYYKRDATGYRNVGFGANVNGIPTSVRRIPVDHIHRFPLAFGDEDSSFSSFSLNVPALFSFTQDQLRINTVDGWGTLYLPADTFEVLRVRSVLQRTDSVYIEQFGQGLSFPEPETVEYKWIAQGMDIPVLQVTTTSGQVTSGRFFYQPEEFSAGIVAVSASTPALFPNPANNTAWLSLPAGMSGRVLVLDASGRVALPEQAVSASATLRLDLSTLAPGSYLVQVLGDAPWTGRLVVRP
jgi:hypothetical protein